MFDFGIGELIVIFAVALIVLGPDKLPQVAKSLGKGLADLKKSINDVKGQVQTEFKDTIDATGIKEALKDGTELKQSLQNITEQVKTDFKDAVDVSVADPPVNAPTKNIADKAEEKNNQGLSRTLQ